MNQQLYVCLAFVLAMLCSCGKSESKELKEALSWVPEDATYFGFDNWNQILEDHDIAETFYTDPSWIDGTKKNDNGRIEPDSTVDRIAIYTSARVGLMGYPEKMKEYLGMSYPDIQWEAVVYFDGPSVIKLQQPLDDAKLKKLVKDCDYRKVKLGEYSIYRQSDKYIENRDENLFMFNSWNCFYYDEKAMVVVAGRDSVGFTAVLDTHYGKRKSILSRPQFAAQLTHYAEAQNVLYFTPRCDVDLSGVMASQHISEELIAHFMTAESLGLDESEKQALGDIEFMFLGEEAGGVVLQSLEVPDVDIAVEANSRAKMLTGALSIRTNQPFTMHFWDVEMDGVETRVEGSWKTALNSMHLRLCLQSNDARWLTCGSSVR